MIKNIGKTKKFEQTTEMNELDGRLKSLGFFESRKNSLERYNKVNQESIVHGIKIRTEFNIDFNDTLLKEGKTEYIFDKDLKKYKISVIQLKDFIKDNIDKNNSWIIESLIKTEHAKLMKLDYLHLALSDIKIVAVEAGQNISDTLIIDRKVFGNSYNHLVFWIKNNTKVKILLKTLSENSGSSLNSMKKQYLMTDFIDIFSEEKAEVCFIEEKLLDNTYTTYSKKFGHLRDYSRIDWINIDKDIKLSYTEHHMKLLGNNSKSNINTILCGRNSEYVNYVISEHSGKDTESLIQQRAVLKSSKAIIKGMIRINQSAAQSNSYQKSDTLLIDDDSRAISIPNLQIHNNDVKCSHGATISRLDEEKIFYIQSRGFNDKDASKIVIEGFFNKVLSIIPDEKLRDKINVEIMGGYDE